MQLRFIPRAIESTLRQQRGHVLVLTLLVVACLSLIGLSMLTMSGLTTRIARNHQQALLEQYLAEAGLTKMQSLYLQNPSLLNTSNNVGEIDATTTLTGLLGGESVTATLRGPTAGGAAVVYSTVVMPDGFTRTVKAEIGKPLDLAVLVSGNDNIKFDFRMDKKDPWGELNIESDLGVFDSRGGSVFDSNAGHMVKLDFDPRLSGYASPIVNFERMKLLAQADLGRPAGSRVWRIINGDADLTESDFLTTPFVYVTGTAVITSDIDTLSVVFAEGDITITKPAYGGTAEFRKCFFFSENDINYAPRAVQSTFQGVLYSGHKLNFDFTCPWKDSTVSQYGWQNITHLFEGSAICRNKMEAKDAVGIMTFREKPGLLERLPPTVGFDNYGGTISNFQDTALP